MECRVTCFDRVMHLVQPLSQDKLEEAVEIIQEYSFGEFLDFCVENDCFDTPQSQTIYEGIVMWENFEGNYWEEDRTKLLDLYDRVGVTDEVFERYAH